MSGGSRFFGACYLLLLWSLGFGIWNFSASAQSTLSNLIFTVGTTINSGQDWSYMVIGSVDGELPQGKRFAVYGKPGFPTNAAAFTQRGTLFRQNSPATIQSLLTQSVALGEDLASLSNALNFIFRKVPGITNQTVPQKILTGLQLGATDPEQEQSLLLMGQMHPGMKAVLGHAFFEPINTVTTYELREINLATGAAGDVIGRVTITPGAPVVLPAPGQPFQVITNLPVEHLLIRSRWGTPPELRRLSLMNFGFNVWRIPRALAEAGNFNITPPTPAQLLSNPNFSRANQSPAMVIMDYSAGTGAGAADDPADRSTYFFTDSGRSTGITFTDGQEFYYFVTARDLLGRDGLVSPGRLMRACRRLTPQVPTDVRVENAVMPSSTNVARLQVNWKQNTNAADLVTQYWIYRWPNPTMALTNEAAISNNLAGVVAQLPGTNFNFFIDNSAGAFTNAGLSNIWYTVRAVSQAACDPLFSPPSAPAWGVLRDRTAPDAATGTLVGSCGTPVVMFQAFATNTISPDAFWHVLLTCQRRDAGIAWVSFTVSNAYVGIQTNGPIYFSPDGDVAQAEFTIPAPYVSSPPIRVGCTVGTLYDQVSQTATTLFNGPIPSGQQKEVVFLAGQLLATALSSSDPLLSVVNGGNSACYPANNVTPDASGMVSMTLNIAPVPLFIQALTNNTWYDVAVVTPDSNGVYWVSYPACLVGPLPQFRGCIVNLPGDSGCDQHVAYASDGASVAPIKVRFKLTRRTREYRVYRRADDGPLTFLAQGAAVYDPANPNKIIETKDEGMPSVPARLCYFVQLLDENGNGSPLSFIGCKESKPGKVPKPVLSEPKPTGTLGSPQVILTWFCPTAGISRFQVKIKRLDPPAPGAPSGFTGTTLKNFPGFDPKATYLGVTKESSTVTAFLAALSFDEAYFTSPIGVGFGPGPQFTLTASVLANVKYLISVTPVDTQGRVIETSTSEAVPFIWTAPVDPIMVPWPARSLPPVGDFDDNLNPADYTPFYPRVRAVLLTDANFQVDPRYPVGICVGYLEPVDNYFSNVRSTGYASYSTKIGIGPIWGVDPNDFVFRRLSGDPSRNGNPLLPIVVYRQQVTNALFPRVSGDITQVSPLLERVPWSIGAICTDCNPVTATVTIYDRLMAIAWKFDQQTYHQHVMLCLRDQQPVQQGAKYRYYVLRFNAKREIQEIIQAGDVDIPQIP